MKQHSVSLAISLVFCCKRVVVVFADVSSCSVP